MRAPVADATRLFAVVGDPIAHSLSPRMHMAAITALGLDARYVPLRTTAKAFPALVHELLADGGGCNVTMPFKGDAAALARDVTAAVRRTGACNTLWGDADRASGDNTDVPAIRLAARRLVGDAAAGVVRVFGTGGAARAAAVAVADEWPEATVEVVSRSRERAAGFLAWAQDAHVRCRAEADVLTPLDLMIWATPVGFLAGSADYLVRKPGPAVMYDGPVPPPALDLNYRPGGTELVTLCRQAHRPAEDGRGVLVDQGALAFERFFGVPAPLAVMRTAVDEVLGV